MDVLMLQILPVLTIIIFLALKIFGSTGVPNTLLYLDAFPNILLFFLTTHNVSFYCVGIFKLSKILCIFAK